MAKTNTGLVAYAIAQLGKPYWYGTFGQKATQSLLTYKARQYPTHYTSSRMPKYKKQIGEKVHDCIGLVKGYLWCENAKDMNPKYNVNQDKGANAMYNYCKERGYIHTMPDIAGVLVFMDGHVGVYIGGGYVVEARGFAYGVVKTKLKERPWTRWGKCPYITYEATKPANKPVTSKPTNNTTATQKTPTKAVASVKAWQNAAIKDGFTFPKYGADGDFGAECESVAKKAIIKKRSTYKYPNLTKIVQKAVGVTVDGKCGDKTAAAIKAYQKKNGLTVDGECGLNTWKKILNV